LSREFQTVGAHTRKEREFAASFIRETVRRLAEVERRSLDGAYSARRSDKYDGASKDRILCVCHTPVLYQNAAKLRITQTMPHAVFLMQQISAKFDRAYTPIGHK